MKMPPFGVKCNRCKTGTIWCEPTGEKDSEGFVEYRRSSTCKCLGLPPLRLDARLATAAFLESKDILRATP